MSKHTNEPWFITDWDNKIIVHTDDDRIAAVDGQSRIAREANAKRIVDCVNALEGLSDDALDGGWNFKDMSKHCREVEQQRDELLEALERIHLHAKGFFLLNHTGDEFNQWFEQAAKAIAKAHGIERNDYLRGER